MLRVYAVNRVHISLSHHFRTTKKHEQGVSRCRAFTMAERMGFVRNKRSLRRNSDCYGFTPSIAFIFRYPIIFARQKSTSRALAGVVLLLWRKGWDSNPCAGLADNRISSAARYDHFDTFPYYCYCFNSYCPDALFKRARAAPHYATQVLFVKVARHMTTDTFPYYCYCFNSCRIVCCLTNGFYYTLIRRKMQAITTRFSYNIL